MDKRKYQTKTLIAEFQDLCNMEEFRFSEKVYRLKDGNMVMEFNGSPYSLYGVRIGFCKCIPRKGICSIDISDYEMWKRIRKDERHGYLIDWENDIFEIMDSYYESLQKCVGDDELPF
jgi:hypothetical protein